MFQGPVVEAAYFAAGIKKWPNISSFVVKGPGQEVKRALIPEVERQVWEPRTAHRGQGLAGWSLALSSTAT